MLKSKSKSKPKQVFDGPYDCPATAFKERCRKERCPEWIHVTGKHPQTDAVVDMFDCARKWLPILMIQFSKEVNGVAASIDSARNDAKQNAAGLATALVGYSRIKLQGARD